jgi:type IV pilus assembly protein PilC
MGMLQFIWSGKAQDGSPREGSVSAWSREQAVNSLLGDGIAVIELTPTQKIKLQRHQGVFLDGQRLTLFYRQLGAMYNAGVPLTPALELLKGQLVSPQETELMTTLWKAISDGSSLADAMRLFPNTFGRPHVAVARAGEVGGFLGDALNTLAGLTERATSLRMKGRSVLAYPLFILGFSLLIVLACFITSCHRLPNWPNSCTSICRGRRGCCWRCRPICIIRWRCPCSWRLAWGRGSGCGGGGDAGKCVSCWIGEL